MRKIITADDLIFLLGNLSNPDLLGISTNTVGNLMIWEGDTQIGFIDLMNAETVFFENTRPVESGPEPE